jgi:hypothetical protein
MFHHPELSVKYKKQLDVSIVSMRSAAGGMPGPEGARMMSSPTLVSDVGCECW